MQQDKGPFARAHIALTAEDQDKLKRSMDGTRAILDSISLSSEATGMLKAAGEGIFGLGKLL